MRDLLNYPSTVYDANCLVYYVFLFSVKTTEDKAVTVEGPNTKQLRRITEILISNNKSVVTIRVAWREAEKVAVASAIKQALQEGYIQKALEIEGTISSMLEYRLAAGLREQLTKLKSEKWFLIDMQFVPAAAKIGALKRAYEEFALDPEKQKKIPPYKGDPSMVDLALIIFSEEKNLPLLTNDRELYNFSVELKEKKLCHLIKGFPQVWLG